MGPKPRFWHYLPHSREFWAPNFDFGAVVASTPGSAAGSRPGHPTDRPPDGRRARGERNFGLAPRFPGCGRQRAWLLVDEVHFQLSLAARLPRLYFRRGVTARAAGGRARLMPARSCTAPRPACSTGGAGSHHGVGLATTTGGLFYLSRDPSMHSQGFQRGCLSPIGVSTCINSWNYLVYALFRR